MPRGLRPFVGRAVEHGALIDSLEAAAGGRGGVWLIAGEPGIGKSRLVEEIASAAGDRFRVHWGRCWEAGGAPPYWPWIQVLRELVAELDAEQLAAPLGQLLPELRIGAPSDGSEPEVSLERARFALLDAATTALTAAAAVAPRLVILDDLHAADTSSVVLLDFLSHAVRTARVLVLGTYRDAEARDTEAGAMLHQVGRRARSLSLPRLDRADVAELVERSVDEPDRELADVVFERSEGNPLFAEALVQVLTGPAPFDPGAVPPTVRTAIRQRLNALPEDAAALLSMAAIWGREIDPENLAAMSGRRQADVVAALADAERHHLVVSSGAGDVRFAHILTAEVALAELDADERARLHLKAAAILERAGASASEIAHHLLAGGDAARPRAIDAAVGAAREARDKLAFDDSVTWLRAALEAIDSDPAGDDRAGLRVAVLTELGGALFRAGDDRGGRRACSDALDAARSLGRADLLARAALELGAVLRLANVDRLLVTALEEAAAALGDEVSPLRVRVLARLAGALQPAEDPTVPVALANEAIDMARGLGDPEILLATLRTGGSALIDMVAPAERIGVQREHLDLARSLGDRVEVFRAATRVAMNAFELGDIAGAEAAIDEVGRVAAELGHPGYRWRVEAFEATRAMWQGRFDDAEAAIARSQALAAEAGDANARAAGLYQRFRLFRLAGRDDELFALVPALAAMFGDTPTAAAYGDLLASAALSGLGREVTTPVADNALLTDWTTRGLMAEIARHRADRDLARVVIDRLEGAPDTFIGTGVIGMTWDEPAHHALANARLTLGDREAAIRHLEAGIDAAERRGGVPVVARLAIDLAELRAGAGDPGARALAERARSIAVELGMRGVAARAAALLESGAALSDRVAPAAEPGPVAIEADGDGYRLIWGDRSLRLRSTKGLTFLAALTAQPGREIHVLDLVADQTGDAPIDLGDAGEQLDAQAREAYRARARDLRAELDDAEANNDLGRVARARAELEFLTAELSRAVGLRGERRAGQAAERARVNVQRRIRDALRRIAEHDEALARHLERSVRTGRFCSYEPA